MDILSKEELKITKTICCWYDLLGYGKPFIDNSWDLTNPQCKKNMERIANVGLWQWGLLSSIYGPKLLLNDGVAACIDINESINSIERALNYLEAMIADYSTIKSIDEREGFPGMRGVISCGDRFEYDDTCVTEQAPDGKIVFYHPQEFQMNTAFSKAFIIEESGSKAGIAGSNLYIDNDVFTLIDDIISKFEGKVETKIEDNCIIKKILHGKWYATLFFEKDTVTYKNKGIDTVLLQFKYMESYPDELSKMAAHQQAFRYSMIEDE